jgi:multicomponent Na+:H+ antiporter subunit D
MATAVNLAVFGPLAAAVLIRAFSTRFSEALTLLASAATLAAAAVVLADVQGGGIPESSLLPLLPGVRLEFRVDALGITFAILASALWLVASVYNFGYVRDAHLTHRRRYYVCFAASIGSAMGIAFAGNLLTFLLFYEMLTIATFPLVAHNQTAEARSGGRRYLAYALSGGLLLTAAIVWTWISTGTLAFVPGGFLHEHPQLSVLFALFLLGCGVKSAIMPLHAWLPAAMVAPTPVSALLHAVAVVKAGVFGCLRLVGYVFGPDGVQRALAGDVLTAACVVTIVVASLLALRQDHLKRRLAYSTIVHLSYIVLGAALLTPLGMMGSVLHLVNHGLTKITLFLCAGSIHAAAHVDYISQMRGLGRRMPWTFAAFSIASLSLIGVPGLCGFVSKLTLARGAWEGQSLVPLAVMLGASLLTAAYLLPLLKIAFFETDESEPEPTRADARPAILFPLLTTAGLVVVFGLVPPAMWMQFELAQAVADHVFRAE